MVSVTMIAHWSSIGNLYAFDDEMLILRNIAVQRGFAGAGEILTKHMHAGYFETTGGDASAKNRHYRPVPVLTFTVEQSVFGRTLGDAHRAILSAMRDRRSVTVSELENRPNDIERQIEESNRGIARPRHVRLRRAIRRCAITR